MAAKSSLYLILLVTMLFAIMHANGRYMDDYTVQVKSFKRSACRIGCWGAFESCINADGTLSGHLICMERKDGCLTEC